MEWNRINLSQLDQIPFEDATQDTDQEIEVKVE
jgi:hypothetical protein